MAPDEMNAILPQLASWFLRKNYDYLWLRGVLEKASTVKTHGSTLITGSSHALNGIQENCWNHAFNCSMHSQDLYYDFQCARWVLEKAERGSFARCFIVMGYYIAFQDLSQSKISRETMIANVYYPIFHDAHNWKTPSHRDLWEGAGNIPGSLKAACEQAAEEKLLEYGTYYSEIHPRGTFFDLKGKAWEEVPQEERMAMGRIRAMDHNKIFQHRESFEENKKILRKFVRFLYEYGVQPIVVITPFSPEYNHFVLAEMREGITELLDSVPEDVHYVDFNQAGDLFEPTDFMDTDHLSESGARKVSSILSEMFGL